MGSNKPSLQGTTSAKQTERKMHLLAIPACLLLLVKMSEAAVAVGVGRLNPENPSECLDPDTGLNHTLGVAWNIPGVCGQAHCELRNQQVYISYAFCGSAQAEAPCYPSSTDLSLPYPYCCPRSICPARLDVHTNLIDTDDYEDELQMAAATWDDASQVRILSFSLSLSLLMPISNVVIIIDVVSLLSKLPSRSELLLHRTLSLPISRGKRAKIRKI